MKLLLQIIIALLIIVGLFLLLGYIVTEQKNINEVEVNAPIEVCWNVYRDESRLGKWMEGLSRIDLIEGQSGQVGAKQKITMVSVDGAEITNSGSELFRTITKVVEPSAFSYDYSNAHMDGRSAITFSQNDSTTLIKSVDIFSGKKLWLRSTLFLMKSSINSNTQVQFDKLKQLIENDYKDQLNREAEIQNEIMSPEVEIE